VRSRSLWFIGPGAIEIRESAIPGPDEDRVLVQTHASAISAGTELLVYRNQFPAGMQADESLPALQRALGYPMLYGYACVGRVTECGGRIPPGWAGRRVFAFHPHESHFLARPADLFPVPDSLSDEEALFLPNLETAVNFLMDGQPLLGEDVAVLGQGIVGILTTALLSLFPLGRLITFDLYPQRRKMSLEAGAQSCFNPLDDKSQNERLLRDFDLVYELSGNPAALDRAIAMTGYGGRVIIGSWYGTKRASLDLGGAFHRSRIRLISSQVSTIAAELRGRWSVGRRLAVAADLLSRIRPARFVTHRFPVEKAAEAFALLDRHPQDCLQVILRYE
jgi:2-desacetyl-2-hydroxyethyl bacteriochlorophyllide A dehydrogenase